MTLSAFTTSSNRHIDASLDINGEDPKSILRNPIIHVTSHNNEGKAIVLSSTQKDPKQYRGWRTSTSLVYTTEGFPPNLNEDVDLERYKDVVKEGRLGIVKPDGTVCRITDYAPENKALMHRTQSIDFGVVLEGTMIMQLDDGSETILRRGDVAVQRGTMHAWKNASNTEWARMMFVLQACEPLQVEGEDYKEDLGPGAGVLPEPESVQE